MSTDTPALPAGTARATRLPALLLEGPSSIPNDQYVGVEET